jgi:hypothetical protein
MIKVRIREKKTKNKKLNMIDFQSVAERPVYLSILQEDGLYLIRLRRVTQAEHA